MNGVLVRQPATNPLAAALKTLTTIVAAPYRRRQEQKQKTQERIQERLDQVKGEKYARPTPLYTPRAKKAASPEPWMTHTIEQWTYRTQVPEQRSISRFRKGMSIPEILAAVDDMRGRQTHRVDAGEVYTAHLRNIDDYHIMLPYARQQTEGRAERLEHMAQLLFDDTGASRMTATQAAAYLGVSKRTIFRDTKYLRELTGEDLRFARSSPFYLTVPVTREEPPTIEKDKHEEKTETQELRAAA